MVDGVARHRLAAARLLPRAFVIGCSSTGGPGLGDRPSQAGVVHGHLADAMLLLTGDGVFEKICGLGEPPWLIGMQHDEEPTTQRDDLRAPGQNRLKLVYAQRECKGPKTKPPGGCGWCRPCTDWPRTATPAIARWESCWTTCRRRPVRSRRTAKHGISLLKYVREHGTAEAKACCASRREPIS